MIVGAGRIKELFETETRTKSQERQLLLLIAVNEILFLPCATARILRSRFNTLLFLVWFCCCWSRITKKQPSPSCGIFFDSIFVPHRLWDKCIQRLNNKSFRIQYRKDCCLYR